MPENIPSETRFFTVPDLVERFGVTPARIHRLIEDHHLAAVRVEGIVSVPTDFVVDDAPLAGLRGTVLVLRDAGLTNDEAVSWLLSPNDELGAVPVAELRVGRKAAVRRATQALAF